MRKKKKKSERTKLIDDCDDIFRAIIRIRDKWTCQRSRSQRNPQVAHNFSRDYLMIRWDEDNACILNAGVHKHWAHVRHEEFRDFWIERIGKERFEELKLKTRYKGTMYTSELKLINIMLKQRLQKLKRNQYNGNS